jgi:hypothetical protein
MTTSTLGPYTSQAPHGIFKSEIICSVWHNGRMNDAGIIVLKIGNADIDGNDETFGLSA